MIISHQDFENLIHARHACPHDVLGMRPHRQGKISGVLVRALVRGAETCAVVETATGDLFAMERFADEGFFEVFIPNRPTVFHYQFRVTHRGEMRQFFDPYCFLPTLSSQDLHLFSEGNEHRIYEKLGSHRREIDGVVGVSFAVWAPSAARVSVVGNFNAWDGRYHPMRSLGASGVWELFVPGLDDGELYKFELRDQAGGLRLKTDPYGTYFESPPNNAAIIYNSRQHEWKDEAWIAQRAAGAGNFDRPISIYEVHLASWRRKPEDANRPLTYRELAPALADYVTEMNFTHIEIMPIAEHPFTGSWGYQVTGFFAPTHRFGTPADFAWFVDYLHQRNIGVILDWVPAHFPRDSFALAEFDGSHLYEHADPRQGAHMDWGTLIFNYGRNEVRCFLVANALAWIDRYHLDGLRVDAVASMLYLDYSRKAGEWIPNQFGGRENLEAINFLRQVNDLVHQYYPGVAMIAEESTSFPGVTRPTWEGGLGFDYKWNMGWMNDTLRYMEKEPSHRQWHHHDLTFGMLYNYSEHFVMVLSHDEVVHGKGSLLHKMAAYHIPDRAANLRAFYAHMWGWPGKKLLFMGSEFAQPREWNFDSSLDWHLLQYRDHEGMRALVRDLNHLYVSEPVLSCNDFNASGFRWIVGGDAGANVIAFLRNDAFEMRMFVVIGHFSGSARRYRLGVPRGGFWKEVINTNSEHYGGNGEGNFGGCTSQPGWWDGHGQSIEVNLPALSTTIFRWTAEE